MSFNQTHDILEHARCFHRRLSVFYEEMGDRAPEEKTRELLENLADYERQLDEKLGEYEKSISPNILDTFFKYMPTTNGCFDEYQVPLVVTSEHVIAAARYFDERLGCFYSDMAKRSLSEKVKEVLLNLLEMELREQMTLSKKAIECCMG